MRNLFGELLSTIIVVIYVLFVLAIIILPIFGMIWLIVSLLTSGWFWLGIFALIIISMIKEK